MPKEKIADQDFLNKQLKRFPKAEVPENWESMTRANLFDALAAGHGKGKNHHNWNDDSHDRNKPPSTGRNKNSGRMFL